MGQMTCKDYNHDNNLKEYAPQRYYTTKTLKLKVYNVLKFCDLTKIPNIYNAEILIPKTNPNTVGTRIVN